MGKYTPLRWAASAAGLTLTGIEVYGAVEYLMKQEGHLSYLVLGGAVVTATAALLPLLAQRQWRGGHYLQSMLLWAALLPALALVLSAAIERTGGARDRAGQERQKIAQRVDLAKDALGDEKAALASAEAAAKAECASGRGPKCLGLEARAEQARQRVSAARTDVARAGVVPRDPQAVRIAAMTPFTEAQVALYQPVILPVTVSVLGIILIWAGHSAPRRASRPAKVKRRVRKPRPQRSPPPVAARPRLVAVNEN